MYDTEKRIELVKSECMNTTAARSGAQSAVCPFCVPAVPVPCGGNGDHAKLANKRHGNVRHNSAA